jgi:sorbitol-specific phosphotransferase system component IIC
MVFSISSGTADGFILVNFLSDFLGSFAGAGAVSVDIVLGVLGALVALVAIVE